MSFALGKSETPTQQAANAYTFVRIQSRSHSIRKYSYPASTIIQRANRHWHNYLWQKATQRGFASQRGEQKSASSSGPVTLLVTFLQLTASDCFLTEHVFLSCLYLLLAAPRRLVVYAHLCTVFTSSRGHRRCS